MYVQFCNEAKTCAYWLVNQTLWYETETRTRHFIFSPRRDRDLSTFPRDRDIWKLCLETEISRPRLHPWISPGESQRHGGTRQLHTLPTVLSSKRRKKLHAPDDGWNPAIFLVLLGGSKANRGINTNGPSGCQHTWSLVPPPPSYPTFLHWMLLLLQLSQLNLSWLEKGLSYAGFAGLHTLSLGYDYNKIILQIQPIYNLSMCILLLLHPFNGLFSRTTWISRH